MKPIDADAFEKYAWSNPDIKVDGEPYISPSTVQNFAADHPITIDPPNEALPVLVDDEPDREYIDYICPRCKNTISQRRRGQRMETVYQCKYHDNCGQRVDWSNPQPYRRPPKGKTHE